MVQEYGQWPGWRRALIPWSSLVVVSLSRFVAVAERESLVVERESVTRGWWCLAVV